MEAQWIQLGMTLSWSMNLVRDFSQSFDNKTWLKSNSTNSLNMQLLLLLIICMLTLFSRILRTKQVSIISSLLRKWFMYLMKYPLSLTNQTKITYWMLSVNTWTWAKNRLILFIDSLKKLLILFVFILLLLK